MGISEIVMDYCKAVGKPLTARNILDARFPGKPQPYINQTLVNLVQRKMLVRDNSVRPYTVRLPNDGEELPEPKDYSKGSRVASHLVWNANPEPVILFTGDDLEEAARLVKGDPRYGEEAEYINRCFSRFPENIDNDIIAMKMALIDMTNSTNLNKHLGRIHLTKLIAKIKDSEFDRRVASGDVSLIGELAENEVNLFSFFSKYCLYHNYYAYKRDDYVIFDGVMKDNIGKFISHYDYRGRTYTGSQIHNCVNKMRLTYDYTGYLTLIDFILERNNIKIKGKHRKFDWFVWYNNRTNEKGGNANG